MILVLPGLQGGAAEVAPLADALGGLALDLPPGSPREAAAALAREIDGPVDVVGASYGALVAYGLPAAKVRRIVAIAALIHPSGVPSQQRWTARATLALPDRVLARAYRRHLRRDLVAEGVDDAIVAALDTPRDPGSIRSRLRGVLRWDVGAPQRPPAGWILGDADPFGPAIAATWRAYAPDVPHVTVAGAHRPHLTNTARVAAWIRDLLDIQGGT